MPAKEPTHEQSSISQEELLTFVLNPRSYPHRPKRVRLVQSHSSCVPIVPPFVYKVKKPMNFGFLDFSALNKRRYFSEREVELNRSGGPEESPSAREISWERAQRYVRLSLQYAVGGSEPIVLIVMGRIGAGKSARARELGWQVFSSANVMPTLLSAGGIACATFSCGVVPTRRHG